MSEQHTEISTCSFSEPLYRRMSGLARSLLQVFYPPEVSGTENLPTHGPYIMCANHISLIDAILIATISKLPLRFMAKKELFHTKSRWFSRFLYRVGAFPVARGESDLSAMRLSLSVLREGYCLGIFPQGTRRKRRAKTEPPMNTGVAVLALKAKVPVVPVYLATPYRLFRKMRVYVGKPIDFSSVGRADSQTLANVTGQIEHAIFALNAPQTTEEHRA